MASTDLEIVISAKDEASAKLKSLSSTAADMGKAFTVVGGLLAGALGVAVKEATDAQVKIASLDAVLGTMGKSALANRDAVLKASQAAVKLGFDDEAAALSIGKLYQRTGDLNEAVKLNALAMDIARFKHVDLETASKAVTLAMSGNGKLFKELGIATKDAGTPMELLAEAQGKVSGQAKAFSETVPGLTLAIKETFNNLSQAIGEKLLPLISQFLTKLQPVIDSIIKWTETHPELTKNIVIATAILAALLLGLAPILFIFSALSPAVIGVAGVIALLAVGVFQLTQHWEQVKTALQPFIAQVKELWAIAAEFLTPAINFLSVVLQVLWDKFKSLWEILAPILIPVLKWLAIFLGATIIGAIAIFIGSLIALGGFLTFVIDIIKILVEALKDAWTWISVTLPAGLATLEKAWASGWNAIKETIKSVADFIQTKIDAIIDAWNRAQAIVAAPIKAIGNVISNTVSSVGKAIGVKDAVITPDGRVINTDPADFIFATKNPASLAGGGGITVNINGGTYLSEAVAIDIGNKIVQRLKLVSRIRV